MSAARVALGILLTVSASQTSEAQPCAPRAELGGDAQAVAKVAVELQRLGVDASTNSRSRVASSCPVIVAAVEIDPSGGIAVAVRDASQRSEGRVVSDAALAAAWIDSWLRDEFAGPPASAARVEVHPAEATAVVAPSPMLDRFSLAASFLQVWSDNSTRWSGVASSLCVRRDGFCVGGRVAYARQTVTSDFNIAAKTDLEVVATASYSQSLGTMSIAPELGLGVGRLASPRIDGCKTDVMCDPTNPMDPNCITPPPKCDPGQVYVAAMTTYAPRISAALRIAIPLAEHVWLDGLAGTTLAPFGNDRAYANLSADGTTMNSNGSSRSPGDPVLGLQLGIGLRLGAR